MKILLFFTIMKIFAVLLSCLIIFKVVFCAQNSLKFGVIADWGGLPIFPYKTFVELSVGREMDVLARKYGMDFILALGDNFYLKGVKDVRDLRFKETYETAFNYDSLNVPWLIIAGNHDHYGNVSAQIAYSAVSKRWNFPSLYYKKTFLVPSSNATVDILMIDTVVLCGNTDPSMPYKQPILSSSRNYLTEQHWKWLETTLKASKANYLLICGHYPVYSIGTHGSTECLVKKLNPLLEKYKVTAYFSGHDHNIQHIQVKTRDKTNDYVVTGGTNIVDPSSKNIDTVPSGSLKYHWGDPFSFGAFTYVEINAINMTVSFYLSSGKILYTFFKHARF